MAYPKYFCTADESAFIFILLWNNKLSNAFTSLVGNFANSDVIVTATNALTGFVKVLDVLTQNPLVTAGIAGTGFGAFKFFKDLDELKNHRVKFLHHRGVYRLKPC